ncbi:MAG: DEAD/DEAH box helicase [Leuconostoc mesenteroides]
MNSDYFLKTETDILQNENLRDPQREAYFEVYRHFVQRGKKTHAIVVLPTGTGKTGLISILPYNIAEGRVLIITPQLTILDNIEKNLDSDDSRNFWTTAKIIDDPKNLPVVIRYEGSETNDDILDKSQIVVANIQKLQNGSANSIMNRCDPSFFDMIIVDEAHHAEAQTWIDNLNYFSNAKVVKLTATAFRTDKKKIVGELVYKYKLSQAMHRKYVKSIEKFDFLPDKLLFTIDNVLEEKYTFDQILALNLKDEDWIARSVAFSKECQISVVEESIKLLNAKKASSTVPHKIIAAASNISEANEITGLYKERGLRAVAIHNQLTDQERQAAFSDIDNHRVDVVVNVSMMGEGYDHKYFSIAAIFRAYKSALPYEQFIGRVLRVIPDDEVSNPGDNIASVVAHKLLFLDELWNYYKNQVQESDVIAEIPELVGNIDNDDDDDGNHRVLHPDFGSVEQSRTGKLEKEVYLSTEYIIKDKLRREERESQIQQLINILNVPKSTAEALLDQQDASKNELKRPDLMVKMSRKATDKHIKEEIVPDLLSIAGTDGKGKELFQLSIFAGEKWITKKAQNDAALLAIYLNNYLRKQIGNTRANWSPDDFEHAGDLLDQQYQYIKRILKKGENDEE